MKLFFAAFSSVTLGTLLTALPGEAATFSSSIGNVLIRYSQSASDFQTDVDTDTFSIAREGGSNGAIADADATFSNESLFSSNSTNSEAFGQGKNYFGLANSTASVLGNFWVEAGQSFGFDFFASLDLLTQIDNPVQEYVESLGSISFFLEADSSPNPIAFFSFSGGLKTTGTDFVSLDSSENIVLGDASSISFNTGGTSEVLSGLVLGSFGQTFASRTQLRLVEVKSNTALAKAPEPRSAIAFLVFGGLTGVSVLQKASKKRQNFN